MSDLHDQVCEDTARRRALSPALCPFGLVDDAGQLLAPRRVDGLHRACVYFDVAHAARAQARWGGKIIDRRTGHRVNPNHRNKR